MSQIRRLFSKIKDGTLREMLAELAWMTRYGIRYRWEILWYTLLGLLGIGMSLGASVMSKYIIDTVLKVDSVALVPAAVFYVSMQLLRIGINAVTARINARIQVDVEQQIRRDVYEKVMNAQWESISSFHSGDILERLDNDVASVSGSVLGWVPDLVTRIVQFVGTLGVILYYDATLALLALISAPVTILASQSVTRQLRRHSKAMRAASSKVMAFTEESFQNLQSIKSFGLTEGYTQQLDTVHQQLRKEKLNYNRLHVRANTMMSLFGSLVAMSCFGWGIYRLWNEQITYGTLTLFLQLAGTLSGAFSALVRMVPGMIGAATAAGRIMAVTELPMEDRSADPQAEAFLRENRDAGVAVEVQALSYGYRGRSIVLENVSFRAEPGQVVALVGPSGEGKTTMLRLILGLICPNGGQVVLHGNGGTQLTASASTRRLFAYVPQRSAFFSGTIEENLRLLNPTAAEEELWEALRLTCAERFVKKLPLGLQSPVQEQGGGFSQGQLQRLMLARALLSPAPVLLLDEATSALDMQTERAVLEGLARGHRQRTCIVTTHRTGVLAMCDRVYRVSGGRVEPLDRHRLNEILAKPEETEETNGANLGK